MSVVTKDPIEKLCGEGDDAEERAIAVREVVNGSGRVLVALNNPWWGNEKFNQWVQLWFADIGKVTEKAVLLRRVVPADSAVSKMLRAFAMMREAEQVENPDYYWERAEELKTDALRDAWGTPRERFIEGFVPKTAVKMMITGDGADDYTIFEPDEDEPRQGSIHEPDVVIRERVMVRSKYKDFSKFAVDCDYEAGQVVSDMDWDTRHPSPKYAGEDQFLCWTVDGDPTEFAKEMNEAGYSVGIRTNLLN